jgi:carbon-monoxide dehydrogenase medium subunit
MNLWQEYSRPTTVAQALSALGTAAGPAIPIAGGTDLMLDLQQGRHAPVHTLVDLTSVREMTALELRGEELFIGAAVPVTHIVRDPLVRAHARALVEASDLIGGPQVRNMATLGGNVAHALPAGDGTIALTALNAQAEVAGMEGTRLVPFTALFLGPGQSALRAGAELVVGFHLPQVRKGQASAFKRIMRPQGVALPILNTAVWIERGQDTILDIRIAVGPAGPTPFRATQAEQTLCGVTFGENSINKALEALLAEARFRSSPQRASADYRRHLIGSLFTDTLHEAWERAGKD